MHMQMVVPLMNIMNDAKMHAGVTSIIIIISEEEEEEEEIIIQYSSCCFTSLSSAN